jgi:hypothetical protein
MSDEIFINETPIVNDITVNTTGAVNSVNNRIGNVLLSASDVGLNQVNNTSDLNKPISNATLSALNVIQSEIDVIIPELNSVYNNVNTLSSNWSVAYTYVTGNSGIEQNQQAVSSFVNANSANIIEVDTIVNTTSANWNDAYTNVTSNSASYVFENIYANSQYSTIQDFAASNPQNIYKGYDVTLINNRVYTFAGSDPTNANHYLEINTNSITPIYQEINLTQNQTLIDSFPLSDFKTAKYTIQIESTFNNDIYYSELNVVALITTHTAFVSEYGLISTLDLVLGYNAIVNVNDVSLYLVHNVDLDPLHQLVVKGSRTNHYKI